MFFYKQASYLKSDIINGVKVKPVGKQRPTLNPEQKKLHFQF